MSFYVGESKNNKDNKDNKDDNKLSKRGFKIDDLTEQTKKVKKIKHESYRKILAQCYAFMKMKSRHGLTECVFEIPHILDSCPPVDIGECALYLAEKLGKDNLNYYFYPPASSMLISWSHLMN